MAVFWKKRVFEIFPLSVISFQYMQLLVLDELMLLGHTQTSKNFLIKTIGFYSRWSISSEGCLSCYREASLHAAFPLELATKLAIFFFLGFFRVRFSFSFTPNLP